MNRAERTKEKQFDEMLGANIRARRIRAGICQEEFAKYLGVHQSSVSRIEDGLRSTSSYELSKIAKFFGCSISDLIGPEEK